MNQTATASASDLTGPDPSQFGDFLCLSVGQLGSGYWAPWYADADPDAIGNDDIDPSPFVQPYLNSHVIVRDDTDFEQFLTGVAKPKETRTHARGRPEVRTGFAEAYEAVFSNGHVGMTKQEAIDKVHDAGGPRISIRTFDRVIRGMKQPG